MYKLFFVGLWIAFYREVVQPRIHDKTVYLFGI